MARATWTSAALDRLADLIGGARHAQGNPEWVERTFEESVLEGIRRLEVFPDLRVRYIVHGMKCGGMTLRSLPLQLFYRQVEPGEIVIFECRWAVQDRTGPQDLGR